MRSFESTARIHLLPAREAPVVIVIRRKPSRLFHVLRWNTETDEITPGSWFRGRIYEMRSDVSFDGEWMTYLASGYTQTTWTGICRPPFLRTVVHWEEWGSYFGGGLFSSPNQLEINLPVEKSNLDAAIRKAQARLPFKVEPIPDQTSSDDEGVLYRRFERDGFVRLGPMPEGHWGKHGWVVADDPGWVKQPTADHSALRVRYRGSFAKRSRVFEFDLPDHPGLLTPEVTWAAYDARNQLVFARHGILYRYTSEGIRAGTPVATIDLEQLAKPAATRPTDDPSQGRQPRFQITTAPLQDQPVMLIVLPLSESLWVRRIHDLAGPLLRGVLAEANFARTRVAATPAFYLRQHTILHVKEPAPLEGYEVLRQTCREVFAKAKRHHGRLLALTPIGQSVGWDLAHAAQATIESAREFLNGNEDASVTLVVGSDEEAEQVREIVARF